ncbi:MAG: hypothetical protein IK131_02340, partial [Paludibacteraceae bacterium]|nr:hypothetical protein [Paludibacteraceae bacterium]
DGGIDLSQPFRLVGNGFASYTQGVAVGLYLLQPFRLMVGDGDGFAFYPRRCHWAKCVTAFQADGG